MNGMDAFGIKKDPLRQGSLAGIDVGADADIPDFCQISFHLHFPVAFIR
jgi:hypothetical protein